MVDKKLKKKWKERRNMDIKERRNEQEEEIIDIRERKK